jgi:hypothetical protein
MEVTTMRTTRILAAALVLTLAPVGGALAAESTGSVKCEMTFSLKGWSAFYKTAKGDGTIKCSNGQSAAVSIKTTGGGITFGKSEIVDGTGKFSDVKGIDELFGSYVTSEAHAGAGKSSAASAMTKGEVSLALAGTGKGIDVGFAFGKFTIEKK